MTVKRFVMVDDWGCDHPRLVGQSTIERVADSPASEMSLFVRHRGHEPNVLLPRSSPSPGASPARLRAMTAISTALFLEVIGVTASAALPFATGGMTANGSSTDTSFLVAGLVRRASSGDCAANALAQLLYGPPSQARTKPVRATRRLRLNPRAGDTLRLLQEGN
jgi:hypothetical protein